jgi:hypothetical protein
MRLALIELTVILNEFKESSDVIALASMRAQILELESAILETIGATQKSYEA